MKEKLLAELYKEFIDSVSNDEHIITEFVKLLSLSFQNILFASAKNAGYDMKKLSEELNEQMKGFQNELKEDNDTNS
jgi:hypothetical protein